MSSTLLSVPSLFRSCCVVVLCVSGCFHVVAVRVCRVQDKDPSILVWMLRMRVAQCLGSARGCVCMFTCVCVSVQADAFFVKETQTEG